VALSTIRPLSVWARKDAEHKSSSRNILLERAKRLQSVLEINIC
jgi:hypothetical protein